MNIFELKRILLLIVLVFVLQSMFSNNTLNANTPPPTSPEMRVMHSQNYFRTQTNAVWLVLVNSPSSVNMSVVLSPDPNFTITHINAPVKWTCNIGTKTCTRMNDGSTDVFEFIQVVGTINNNCPTSVTNSATLYEASLMSPVLKSDVVSVYNPSKVFQWGANNFGQTINQYTGADLTQLAFGFKQSLGLKTDGSIVEWGSQINTIPTPTGNNFVSIVSSSVHSVALTNEGQIVDWGLNPVGQLDNTPTGNGFIALATNQQGSIALTNEGKIVVWGTSNYTDLPTGPGYLEIAGGYEHGLGLNYAGTIVQWGANNLNQRTGLPAGADWKRIASTSYNGIAQRQDNTLYEWGSTSNNPSAGIPNTAVEAFGSTSQNSGAWAMFADGSLTVWGDAFGVYQTNKPTQNGFVLNSLAFGLNGAGILKPLSNPMLNLGNNQMANINTAFSIPISIKVLDNTGLGVQNLSITFTSPNSGASAFFSNGQNSITAFTDANGIASASITANGTPGAFNVTASYTGLDPFTFQLTNVQNTVKNISTNATYPSLQAAINAAVDGETIELLTNIIEPNINISHAVVLNASGYTLTIPTGVLSIPTGKSLTWQENNLVILSGATLNNNGTLINNGTIVHSDPFTNTGIYKGSGIFQGQFVNNGSVTPGQ